MGLGRLQVSLLSDTHFKKSEVVEISFMDWDLCEKSHILPEFECMSSISTWTFFCLVTSCQKNHTIFIFNKYIFILVKKKKSFTPPKKKKKLFYIHPKKK